METHIEQKPGDWVQASQPGTYPKINSIFDFSEEALGQLKLRLEQMGLNLPISNIIGFQQFTANIAEVATEETTTSATFTDLATTGPTLSGLPAGKYAILFGASAKAPAAQVAYMGVSLNAAAASNSHVAENEAASQISIMHGLLTTLSLDNNSVQCKYRISGGASAGTWRYRWVIALKYDNP